MAHNGSGRDTPKQQLDKDKDKDAKDLVNGRWLLGICILVVVGLGALYVVGHLWKPNGLFAPLDIARKTVSEARTALDAADADILTPTDVASLTQTSGRLQLLSPQLGVGAGFTEVLTQLDTQLAGNEVNRVNLTPLLDRLNNIIQTGSSSFFWQGTRDRWVELTFWTVMGSLMFLLSEIKRFYSKPYQHTPRDQAWQPGMRNFELFTPWYVVNFFRGPFIGLLILLALTSISFDAIGISFNAQSASMEVLIILAGIMGFYSRMAEKQLDLIAKKLLPDAWQAANPSDKVLSIKPPDQPLIIKAAETRTFTVQPKIPVRWLLDRPEPEVGTVAEGTYTAPGKVAAPVMVTLLAVPEDDGYNIARLKFTLEPEPPPKNSGNGANRPAVQPAAQPAVQSGAQPPAQPVTQSTVTPAAQPGSQPPAQPVTQSVVQPAAQSTVPPAVQPATPLGARPAVKLKPAKK